MNKVTSVSDALEHTMECADYSNGVFEFATSRNGRKFFREAVALGLLTESDCVVGDGDGFIQQPERWVAGYKLTDAGRAALAARKAGS